MIEMSEYDRLNEGATPRPWHIENRWAEGDEMNHRISRGEWDSTPFDYERVAGNYEDEQGGIVRPADTSFIVALANAADDIKRLWEATVPFFYDGRYECPCCGQTWLINEKEKHYPDCPHIALRPLFGDDSHA